MKIEGSRQLSLSPGAQKSKKLYLPKKALLQKEPLGHFAVFGRKNSKMMI